MRINCYAEELLDEVEIITKPVYDDLFGKRTFYGVRVYLASPDVLHSSPEDDDRSAITFWVPWTRANGHDFDFVEGVFNKMYLKLKEAQAKESVGGE